MKILFVLPRDASDFGHKPIGISYLSAIAKRYRYRTKLFDTGLFKHEYSLTTGYEEQYTNQGVFKPVNYGVQPLKTSTIKEETREVLKSYEPNIIAISLFFPFGRIAQQIIRTARTYLPYATIIMGGPQVTADPKGAIALGPDYINVGEGLSSWPTFLRYHINKRNVGNLGYIMSSVNRKYIQNPLHDQFQGLEYLPKMDYSIYEERHFLKAFDGKIYRGIDYMATWGCPNKCTYCINGLYRKLYNKTKNGYCVRHMPISRMISELIYLADKYDLNFIKFCDENFLLMPRVMLTRFAKEYNQRVGLPFTTAVHPSLVTTEKLRILKDAGCVSLSIGIENGDTQYRTKTLGRTDKPSDILKAFILARHIGIRTQSFNMCGTPGYTQSQYDKTVTLNRLARPDAATMSLYLPLPGTPLTKKAIKDGLLSKDWEDKLGCNYLDYPILKLKSLSRKKVMNMRHEFQKRVRGELR